MYFCTIVSGGDTLHENSLVLEDDADIMEWGNIRRESLDMAIEHVVTSSSNDMCLGEMPLYFLAKKYTTDGIAILSATDTENIITWNRDAHEQLNGLFKNMFRHIDDGNVVVVNSAGGYFTVKKSEIKLNPSMVQCKMDVTDETLDKFVLKGIVPNYHSTIKYFCYVGNGKCIYEPVLLHDLMLRMHKYDVDKAYKFIYYTKDSRERVLWNEYGIEGLRDSVVYDIATRPFELNKADLDAIEKFIKETFEINVATLGH